MKSWKKAVAALLCLSLAVFGGCGKDSDRHEQKEPEKDMFPYYKVRTDRKTDGQYYENGVVSFPASLWQTPSSERCEALDREGVQGYFIDSVQGTKVFCYVGIPESASAQNKVPAVVLVHGATGTAFYDWVKMWTDKGYAAIAMDTEGRMPTATLSTMDPEWGSIPTSSKPHGPVNQAFADSDNEITTQWVYHALASVIASASFIASFEEVDGSKLGITGVSYGGFLTCLAVGYDDRYSFAAPVYGCLTNARGAEDFGTWMKAYPRSVELWDGVQTLQAARTPVRFVNSDTDHAFAPDCTTRSAAACAEASISLRPHYPHGHYHGAKVDEVFAMADEVFYGKNAMIRVTGDVSEGFVRLTLPPAVTVQTAKLCYTLSDTMDKDTLWLEEDAQVAGNDVIVQIDESRKHYFVRVCDNLNRYVCSNVA